MGGRWSEEAAEGNPEAPPSSTALVFLILTDPDRIQQEATAVAGGADLIGVQRNQARDKPLSQAANVFTGPLINLIDIIGTDD